MRELAYGLTVCAIAGAIIVYVEPVVLRIILFISFIYAAQKLGEHLKIG